MINIGHTTCCGIKDIDGISNTTPKETIRQVGKRVLEGNRFAFIMFSSNDGDKKNGYGDQLKKYIEKHGYGTVIATESAKNPNSERMIKGFLWQVDVDAVMKDYSDTVDQEMARLGIVPGAIVSIKKNSGINIWDKFDGEREVEGIELLNGVIRMTTGNVIYFDKADQLKVHKK